MGGYDKTLLMAVAPSSMVDGRVLIGRDFGTRDLLTLALQADEVSSEKREDHVEQQQHRVTTRLQEEREQKEQKLLDETRETEHPTITHPDEVEEASVVESVSEGIYPHVTDDTVVLTNGLDGLESDINSDEEEEEYDGVALGIEEAMTL